MAIWHITTHFVVEGHIFAVEGSGPSVTRSTILYICTPLSSTSPRLCPSTAECNPPSMSSIVFCLLLSCFTFHLDFVHPLQNVALHQCLPSHLLLSCCRWFLPKLYCRLAIFFLVVPLIPSLSLDATLCNAEPTYYTTCPAHFRFCFSVNSIMSFIFVLFLISEHGTPYPYHLTQFSLKCNIQQQQIQVQSNTEHSYFPLYLHKHMIFPKH